MNRATVVFAAIVLFLQASIGQAATGAAMESRLISGPESAGQWTATECTLQSSTDHSRNGKPLLHWHVTVDYLHGEPKYLIGWPRITLAIKDKHERDWSGWEYLQAWIYTDTSRDSLPASEPAGLSFNAPDREHSEHVVLKELTKGKWVLVRIPISSIAGLDDVRMFQFNISERVYRHLDQVDFYIDGLSLTRYAQPTIVQFSAESQLAYCDAGHIAVQFEVRGLRAGQNQDVVCQLLRDNQVVSSAAGLATAGLNRFVLNVNKAKLAEGEYEVCGRLGGAVASSPVRLVKSPWESTK